MTALLLFAAGQCYAIEVAEALSVLRGEELAEIHEYALLARS